MRESLRALWGGSHLQGKHGDYVKGLNWWLRDDVDVIFYILKVLTWRRLRTAVFGYRGCLRWKPRLCSSQRNHNDAQSRRRRDPATTGRSTSTSCLSELTSRDVFNRPVWTSLTSTDAEGSGAPSSRSRWGAVASRQISDQLLVQMSNRFIPEPAVSQSVRFKNSSSQTRTFSHSQFYSVNHWALILNNIRCKDQKQANQR